MTELEPNIDIYGTYARASAVADFIELVSLRGLMWSKSAVADYIEDLSWGKKLQEIFLTPNEVSSTNDEEGEGLGGDSEDAVDRVFSLFEEREAYLGNGYPFHLNTDNRQLELLDATPSPYLALLAITIAHSFDIEVEQDPRTVFEDTVSQALNNAGHRTINFAKFRKNYSNFNDALEAAGAALALFPAPLAAPISLRAQDAGGDVLAHVNAAYTPNGGIGAWTLVGQVTCGQSHTWNGKLGEVEVPAWKSRLGAVLPPQAFLAVPHHAERVHLQLLVTNNERMVLDRLRLTKMLDAVSGDEQVILDAVLRTPVAR